jgi:folate-binding protein YgfZ
MNTKLPANQETVIGYQAALKNAALYLSPEAGYLRISGSDQVSFLQRQTTNNINLLVPGHSMVTVLTSATGRILDVLTLLTEPGGALGAMPLPGQAANTANFLKSRVFFMDKVSIADASKEFVQIELTGPQVPGLLGRLGCQFVPQQDEVLPIEIGGVKVILIRQPSWAGMDFRLLAPVDTSQDVIAALLSQGAIQITSEIYQVLRVEAGVPGAGTELTSDYTPLETGLSAAVAENKGCYTGQEVIARQMTYDKVTQHMVGLRLQNLAQTGERIFAEGRAIGSITTCVDSPRFGPIALAILKRPYHQPGTQVMVGNGDGEKQPQTALVIAPPFSL